MVATVYLDPLEGTAVMEKKVRGGRKEIQVPQAPQVPPVHSVVEWSTPGGGGPSAQAHKELNWSTKE